MKDALLRWGKFSAVGSLGLALQLAVFFLLTGPMGLHYLAATAAAVESAILHNFLWHDRWTWADRRLDARRRLARLLRFNATTGLVSILGNVAFMRLYVGEAGMPYLLGSLASIASCALVNYLVNDRFVFADLPGEARRA